MLSAIPVGVPYPPCVVHMDMHALPPNPKNRVALGEIRHYTGTLYNGPGYQAMSGVYTSYQPGRAVANQPMAWSAHLWTGTPV